jgi:hypothetical protein
MLKKVLFASFLMLSCAFVNAQAHGSSPVQAPSAPANTDPNAPVMAFDVKDHDFGTIEQDANGTFLFLFTNTGKEPLVIKEAHGSCGCTVPRWPHNPVNPGQQDTIKVTYDTHRVGVFQKTVTITSNAKESPVVLAIKGKVTAKPAQPAFPTDPSNNSSGAPFSNNWDSH